MSFGNSRRAKGLRFNFSDNGIERIIGLNITLWKPYDNRNGIIKGGAVGIWAPDAGIIRGVTLGGMGTRGQDVSGLMLNVVGYEGPENFKGLGRGLIATGAEIQFEGISAAGIITGGGDLYRGLGVSPIAVGVSTALQHLYCLSAFSTRNITAYSKDFPSVRSTLFRGL